MEAQHPLETLLLEKKDVWAVRLAKLPDLSLQTTYECIKQISESFIVSEEGSGDTLHQHIYMCGDLTRSQITEAIKVTYPTCKGNKNIYCQPAKKKKQLLKYTIKEKCFLSTGFSSTFIQDLLKLSRPKTDLKDSFVKLEEQLLLGKITFAKYVTQYLDLKVKHDQNLYTSHLIAFFRKMAIRSGNYTTEVYAEYFIEQLFNQ